VDEDQKLIAAGTESEKEGLGDVAIYIWYVRNGTFDYASPMY